MDTNPYAPPLAALAESTPEASAEPPLFAVSLAKLLVLCTCTLGLYEIYWAYQHWVRIKRREGSDIIPAARAFFGVIFCYALFARVRDAGKAADLADPPPAGLLAIAWIVATVSWKLPDPWWLLSMLSPLLMLPIQAYANRLNAAVVPDHDRNGRFGAANIAWTLVGGLTLMLAIAGAFMPE